MDKKVMGEVQVSTRVSAGGKMYTRRGWGEEVNKMLAGRQSGDLG